MLSSSGQDARRPSHRRILTSGLDHSHHRHRRCCGHRSITPSAVGRAPILSACPALPPSRRPAPGWSGRHAGSTGCSPRPTPTRRCELDFDNPFELLVVTVLSAQTTDKRVNAVRPTLFAAYPDARAMAAADRETLEGIIGPLGFFRAKTESLLKLSAALVERHDGEVPPRLKDLVELPGVGRKTANVVLGNAFGIPGITVDTHFGRLARRFGWTEETDPVKAEHAVGALFPKRDWTMLSHHLIWHGRRCCHAQKPACGACPVAQVVPVVRRRPDRPRDRRQAARGPRAAHEARRSRGRGRWPCVAARRLLGADDDKADMLPTPDGPPPSSVEVDTPELRDAQGRGRHRGLRARTGRRRAARRSTLACLGGGPTVDLSVAARPDGASTSGQSGATPCEQEMPVLQAFHEQYGDQVAVLGVDSTDRFPGTALEQLARARRHLPPARRPRRRPPGHRGVRAGPRLPLPRVRRRGRRRSPTRSSAPSSRPRSSRAWSRSTSG